MKRGCVLALMAATLLGAAPILAMAQAAGDEGGATARSGRTVTRIEPRSGGTYPTPYEMRHAKPMPMPSVDGPPVRPPGTGAPIPYPGPPGNSAPGAGGAVPR